MDPIIYRLARMEEKLNRILDHLGFETTEPYVKKGLMENAQAKPPAPQQPVQGNVQQKPSNPDNPNGQSDPNRTSDAAGGKNLGPTQRLVGSLRSENRQPKGKG